MCGPEALSATKKHKAERSLGRRVLARLVDGHEGATLRLDLLQHLRVVEAWGDPYELATGLWPWDKIQIVPPVNIAIPTKIE